MKYIVHRRFKDKALCGDVNLPAMTVLENDGGIIYHNGNALCYEDCENAHQFFARDDDGNGMLRGKLTQSIQQRLSQRDKQYQERWDKVWDDPACQPYKRADHDDHWLWNHSFFNADIDVLRHIAQLVGAKEGA